MYERNVSTSLIGPGAKPYKIYGINCRIVCRSITYTFGKVSNIFLSVLNFLTRC